MRNLHVVRAAAALILLALFGGCASRGAARSPANVYRDAVEVRRPDPGEPFRVERFRIGWYDSAGKPETPARLRAMGFDTVMPYSSRVSEEEIREFLSASEREGIGVHLDIPRRLAEEAGDALEEYVRTFSDSPSVLSWYLYDEPEWKMRIGPGRLEEAYRRVKAADASRPVDMVFILPGLSAPYLGSVDRMWIDWYPLARGSPEFAAFRGGRYADRMKSFGRRADRYGLPLTIVPQGFGEKESGEVQFTRRLPTPAEARYMFWASFLARPEEIVYWVLYRSTDAWLEDALLPVLRDFRDRFPVTVEYLPSDGFRIEGGRTDRVLLGNGQERRWLVVLGREGRGREVRIEAPGGYAFRLDAVGDSKWTREVLDAYGVLVLEISEIR